MGTTTPCSLAIATPVLLLVLLYLVYATIYFRQPKGAVLEGPAVRGDARVQTTWIIVTSLLVLGLAVFGTVRLEAGDGAGSGCGPEPADGAEGPEAARAGDRPAVAVHLPLPDLRRRRDGRTSCCPSTRMVELHVTSLDVIHSFWAYQLGVKADANPQVDNVAFVKPTKLENFNVRCAELCGLWHGYMFDTGRWSRRQPSRPGSTTSRRGFAPATKSLPKYSTTYLPEPTEAWRMSTTSVAASAPQPAAAPAVAPPARLQPAHRRDRSGIGGYYLGWFIGHQIDGPSFEYESATDENDVALLLGYFFGVVGFLIGLGFANYPVSRLLGRPASLREKEGEGIGRYFGLCTDHKVVGIQYLVGIGVFFFVGGLNAMLIRVELLHPTPDGRRPRPVPVARGHARHDDDGDDDLGHPRARSPTTSCRS